MVLIIFFYYDNLLYNTGGHLMLIVGPVRLVQRQYHLKTTANVRMVDLGQ